MFLHPPLLFPVQNLRKDFGIYYTHFLPYFTGGGNGDGCSKERLKNKVGSRVRSSGRPETTE